MRPSALPPAPGPALSRRGPAPSVPRRPRVRGAPLPQLLLAALPPLGGVRQPGPPAAPADPVRAQHRLPGQQLRPHHTHLQEGQSAAGTTGGKHLDYPLKLCMQQNRNDVMRISDEGTPSAGAQPYQGYQGYRYRYQVNTGLCISNCVFMTPRIAHLNIASNTVNVNK